MRLFGCIFILFWLAFSFFPPSNLFFPLVFFLGCLLLRHLWPGVPLLLCIIRVCRICWWRSVTTSNFFDFMILPDSFPLMMIMMMIDVWWIFTGLQGVLNEDDIAGKRKPRAAAAAAALVSLSAFSCLTTTGGASAIDIVNVSANPAYGEVGALLEVSVQFIYLGALLVLLGVGSFLVVRQVLIRRELESAAKELQVPHEIIFTDLVTEQTYFTFQMWSRFTFFKQILPCACFERDTFFLMEPFFHRNPFFSW